MHIYKNENLHKILKNPRPFSENDISNHMMIKMQDQGTNSIYGFILNNKRKSLTCLQFLYTYSGKVKASLPNSTSRSKQIENMFIQRLIQLSDNQADNMHKCIDKLVQSD